MRTPPLTAVAVGALLIPTFWPRPVSSHSPTFTTVVFKREIAQVFEKKCLQCHGEHGMAMPLGAHADARPWAIAIKEEILGRRMPPWPAERGYGEFANDAGLTAREMEFLISWIDGGGPKGGDELPEPIYADHSGHWMLGTPDTVLTASKGVTVEARAAVGFMRVTIDPGLAQDRWVEAIDFKPGDKRLARAAFFTVAETGQYLGGWTPSHSSTQLPKGVAFKLPARSKIAVNVLAAGGDETVIARPSIALYFAKETPARAMTSVVLRPRAARPVAPGLARQKVTADLRLAADTTVFALRPELGAGGRSIEIRARRPDGSVQVLLWIKNFNREWQTPFILKHPLPLPSGSTLQATAYFDNQGSAPAVPTLSVTFNTFATAPFRVQAATVPAGPLLRTSQR